MYLCMCVCAYICICIGWPRHPPTRLWKWDAAHAHTPHTPTDTYLLLHTHAHTHTHTHTRLYMCRVNPRTQSSKRIAGYTHTHTYVKYIYMQCLYMYGSGSRWPAASNEPQGVNSLCSCTSASLNHEIGRFDYRKLEVESLRRTGHL